MALHLIATNAPMDCAFTERKIPIDEKRYKSLYDNNIDAVFQFDLDGYFVDVNDSFLKMFGYSLHELYHMSFRSVVVDDDVASATSVFERTKQGNTTRHEVRVIHRNGKRMTVQVISVPIVIEGKVTGTFGIVKDITTHRYAQELLENQKRILEMTATRFSMKEILYELTRIVEYHAPSSMCNVWLLEKDQRTLTHFVGHNLLKAYADELGTVKIGPSVGACGTAAFLNEVVTVQDIDRDALFTNYRSISGKYGLKACFASPIVSSDGIVVGTFGLYFDDVKQPKVEELDLLKTVSYLAGLAVERERHDENIRFLAQHDALTGLPNRTLFVNKLRLALQNAQEKNHVLALLFVDLDRFKTINDSMGHHVGDRLLQLVAERLQDCLKSTDILCRMGGDEFTLFRPHISGVDEAVSIAKRLLDSFNVAFNVGNHTFRVTVSIGIAVSTVDVNHPQILMRNADMAMYDAKNKGKSTFSIYTEPMNETFYGRLMLESALRSAVSNDEFCLYYQPRIRITDQSVTSIEALIRWNKPDEGIVLPSEFISIAEESGLIVPIGKWVLDNVCRQMKRWETSGQARIRMAINVSTRQLQEPDFLTMLKDVIRDVDVDPQYLEIEVTESGLMENESEVVAILHALKSMGIHISIDDFGIGYSSLSKLSKMPVDTLKIDQSFIRDMLTNNDAAIIKTIIALAHNLNMTVVAEGVEIAMQIQKLKEFECDEIQGNYYTPPVTIEDFSSRYMSER